MANIPTGGAPLFLGDFATPTAAIGQKMTQRMIEQNKADQTRRGKERTAMLKALDFTAVEGLSKKVSMEHLEQNNALTDKWAERWLTQGKKLTDKDYLELEQDKRKLQQDVADKKHNVAQVAYAQNQLKTNPYNWDPSSLDRLNTFIKEGNIGRDASQILVPQYDVLGALQGRIKSPQFGKKETIKYDEASGKNIVTTSNAEAVDATVRSFIENDPKIQDMLNSPDPVVRERALADINSYREFHTREDVIQKPLSATEMKEKTKVNLTADQQAIDAKFDWTGKGMQRKHFQNMAELNNEIGAVLRKDREALNRLNGTYVRGLGTVNRAIVDNDGNVTLLGGTSKSPREMTINVPKDWGNKKEVTASMLGAADALRPDAMTSGKLPTNYTDFLEPEWDTQVGDVAGNTLYEDLKEEAGKKKPDHTVVTGLLEGLFEDETIEQKDKKLFGLWANGVKFAGKKYKSDSPSDMEALIKAVKEKKGFITSDNEDENTPISYSLGGATYSIPPDEVEEFLKDNPTATEDRILGI